MTTNNSQTTLERKPMTITTTTPKTTVTTMTMATTTRKTTTKTSTTDGHDHHDGFDDGHDDHDNHNCPDDDDQDDHDDHDGPDDDQDDYDDRDGSDDAADLDEHDDHDEHKARPSLNHAHSFPDELCSTLAVVLWMYHFGLDGSRKAARAMCVPSHLLTKRTMGEYMGTFLSIHVLSPTSYPCFGGVTLFLKSLQAFGRTD